MRDERSFEGQQSRLTAMDHSLPIGWKPLATSFPVPGGEMIPIDGPKGERGVAIRFRQDLINHPVLVDGLAEFMPFMRDPRHDGVVPLLHWGRRQALFIYETGDRVLLGNLMEQCARRGLRPGELERAAMELLHAASGPLDGALRRASAKGLTNHNSLDRWRILIDAEGEVSLLGYGLPPMDAIGWMDEGTGPPPEDGIAHWPPERIQDHEESICSDIYALAAIATELATGRQLLRDLPLNHAIDVIVRGEGLQGRIRELGGLTREVRLLLMDLLHQDPDRRPQTAGEMGLLAKNLLGPLTGRSLADLVREMNSSDGAESSGAWARADEAWPSAIATGQPDPLRDEAAHRSGSTAGFGPDDDEELTARIELPIASREVPLASDEGWTDSAILDDEDLDLQADDLDEPDWGPDEGGEDTPVPHPDDVSEEVPRGNLAAQYETSGVFASLASDHPPQPPPDEQLRNADPHAQWAQGNWDDQDALLDAPVPSLVDEDLGDTEGPTLDLDSDSVSHTIGGMATRSPTLSADDIHRTEAEATRRRDAEMDDVVARHLEDQARAEEVLSELPQVDDAIDSSVSVSSFEPMGPAPQAFPERFEAPLGVTDEVDEDLDSEPAVPSLSLSAAREAWPDAPDQILLSAAKVDLRLRQVLHDTGGLQGLTRHQTALLAYLAGREGHEVSSSTLAYAAMHGKASVKSVPGIIARIRAKIERDPSDPEHLLDGDDGGYMFVRGEYFTPGAPSLPEPSGELPGRDREIREITDAMRQEALVTVVGPPGAGASQVALRVAIALNDTGREVYRVGVSNGESASQVLAQALGIRRLGRDETEIRSEIGLKLLKNDQLVVFLDAARDVDLAEVRAMVHGWMSQRPRGAILVAGRNALGISGERPFTLGALRIAEAIDLFRKRVAHHRPGTMVSDALAATVVERLDRMPVHIEVAARQTAFESPESLRDRLEQGDQLDWGEDELGADLDTNLDRIDPVERKVLQQLVVFHDGFELSSAEAVVKLPDPTRSLLSILDSLAAKSLIRSSGGAAQGRRMVYETARPRIRREMDPSDLEEAQRRHAEAFGDLGLEFGAGPWAERRARDILVREKENLWAALQYAVPESAGAALGLTSIIGREDAGRLREAVDRWLAQHKRNPPGKTDLDLLDARPAQGAFDWTDRRSLTWQAAARLASARLDLHLGQPQKSRASLRETTELGVHEVKLLAEVGWLHAELGSTIEAKAALNKVSSADEWVRGIIALLRGRIHATAATDVRKGERALIEAQNAFKDIDADVGMAHVQRHLAEIFVERGNGRRALSLLREALQTFEDVEDQPGALRCRMRIAELHVGLGQRAEALAALDTILESARQSAAHGLLALARGILGVVHTMDQDFEEGERLFFLALAGSAPDHKYIQALFALALLLKGDLDTAHEEARGAGQHPVAQAVVAVLERTGPPSENETAFLLYEALESWRSAAAMARFDKALEGRPSIAVRMVLKIPPSRIRSAGK